MNQMRLTIASSPRHPSAIRARLVSVLACLSIAACKGVLDVNSPGRIPATQLENSALAEVLVNGALGDAECALDSYNAAAAWLSDEYDVSSGNVYLDNLGARRISADDKMLNEGTCDNEWIGSHLPLQIARSQIELVVRRLQEWTAAGVPGLGAHEARLRAYGGFVYLALGEGFAAAAFGDGRILPPDSALARAESWFTAALSTATNDTVIRMARVGRARVRLDGGNTAGAIADASTVPAGFAAYVSRGTESARRYNKLYVHRGEARVAAHYLTLTVGGAPDPRVTLTPVSAGSTSYMPSTHSSESARHRLASFKEAQYVLAEAQGGTAAVNIINALRDSVRLPHFAGGTAAQILAQIDEERAREFFAEGGIRLNDLLRHNLTWKTGTDPNGGTYGTTRRLPLPRNETEGIP